MSDRKIAEARTIHPRALKELGEEACIVALGVARDLRSGVIPPEKFKMSTACGSSCCIVGHIAIRLFQITDPDDWEGARKQARLHLDLAETSGALEDLFAAHPSNSHRAADAIERYVYSDTDEPWKVPAMTGG